MQEAVRREQQLATKNKQKQHDKADDTEEASKAKGRKQPKAKAKAKAKGRGRPAKAKAKAKARANNKSKRAKATASQPSQGEGVEEAAQEKGKGSGEGAGVMKRPASRRGVKKAEVGETASGGADGEGPVAKAAKATFARRWMPKNNPSWWLNVKNAFERCIAKHVSSPSRLEDCLPCLL